MKTFLSRSLSSVILLSLFGLAIFAEKSIAYPVFSLLVLFLAYSAVTEFGSILKKAGQPVHTRLTAFVCALCALMMLIEAPRAAFFVFVCFQMMSWGLFLFGKNKEAKMRAILNSMAILGMFAIPVCMMVDLYMRKNSDGFRTGPMIFLFLILVTKIGDIGAYVTGSLCNWLSKGHNHKMIPSISPGKSWEGFAGGLFFTLLLSSILWPLCGLGQSTVQAIVIGLLLFFGCVAGDLAESAFKRTCAVKDSGHTLPGIGGILDLVDSLMINAPLFWLYLSYFYKAGTY